MKHKKQQKQVTIRPRGASQHCVGERAPAGEAAACLNVRECDDALLVVGQPQSAGSIAAGHRLLLVDDDRRITLSGDSVMLGEAVLTRVEGDVVGAHRVGVIVVITTTAGIVWLRRTAQSYERITLADACPAITLSALEWDSLDVGLEALAFGAPYAQWPTTLSGSDVSRLTAILRQGWHQLQRRIDSGGYYGGVMQVRCGVRLADDTYLWLSDPVTLGTETVADAQPLTVEATLDGTQVTGIVGSTLTRRRYRVGITVDAGIAEAWLPLVKAVDILATTCADVVSSGDVAQYRCIGIGGSVRRPQLEMGLPAVSAGAIHSGLSASGWHVVASTTDLSGLNRHQWVSDGVAPTPQVVTPGRTSYVVTRAAEASDRLTASQAAEVVASGQPLVPIASMTSNGRLYCIDAQGTLAVSALANPLVSARQQALTGAVVRCIMPLCRAIYSNGFGRYPVALFTDEGIYALPQTTAGGRFGEPRLLSRVVIGEQCHPVEGDRDVYFVSSQGHLCRLRGSEVQVMWRDVGQCSLAWDEAHRELWMLLSDGSMLALLPSGRVSGRSVTASQIFADTAHTWAVQASGQVLDLQHEVAAAAQAVQWQSHSVVAGRLTQVMWLVMGQGELTLSVMGERGVSCHGFAVGRLRVSGIINAPLRQRLVPVPLRTLRLSVGGTACSGTMLISASV